MLRKILFLIPILIFLLSSCGTKSVMINVVRPAEVNLKGYDKIAVGQIVNAKSKVNAHAEDVASEITARLVQSQRFEVVDRQHLKEVMAEQSLALTGMLDESSAPQVGKLLGVSVLIFGRLQQDQYKENTSEGKPYKDKKGNEHQRNTRTGTHTLSAALKLIDVETGKVLTVQNLTVTKNQKQSAVDKRPAPINRATLYKNCVTALGDKFIRKIAPYNERVKASFETDDELPEVDQAVAMFKIGEWPDGMELLQKSTRKSKLKTEIKAKTFYNLGLAQIYQGQYEQAIENIKTAIKLNPDSSRYMQTLKRAKTEQQKAKELEDQLEGLDGGN